MTDEDDGLDMTERQRRVLEQAGETSSAEEFQERLEENGLQVHWREVGKTFQENRGGGDDPETALRNALDIHSSPDADIDTLWALWICQRGALNVTYEVEIEFPEDVREAIERRMALFGRSPETHPEQFLDLALETIHLTLSSETEEMRAQ